jgi:hypothetical protein
MKLEEFEAAVYRIMAEVTTMTLATCAGGIPWATDVYFSPDGFDLIFFSSPDSRHCRNLAVNPVGAVTIHPGAASWRDIRGLQMEGACEPVASVGGKARAYSAYFRKFPFARALISNPEDAANTFSKATAHLLRPSRILYLDNSLGFGTRWCLRLANGRPAGPPEQEGKS